MQPRFNGYKIARIVASHLTRLDSRGRMKIGAHSIPCVFGRTGVTTRKREGDGATPIGAFRVVATLFRPDRMPRRQCAIPTSEIKRTSGWCDDPSSPNYNRPVKLPSMHRHEKLHRADELYDQLLVLDYNLKPRKVGAGSAIFFHVAHKNFAPTEGCVAICVSDMRRLLPRLSRRLILIVR